MSTNPTDRLDALFSGSDDGFESVVQGILGQESGGNYHARNPDSGALGKYQILASNLPSWGLAHVGRPVSPGEFLKNPSLQDQIARGQLRTYYDDALKASGGDRTVAAKRTAAAWYSGSPEKYRSTTPQGKYPSVAAYAANVAKRASGQSRLDSLFAGVGSPAPVAAPSQPLGGPTEDEPLRPYEPDLTAPAPIPAPQAAQTAAPRAPVRRRQLRPAPDVIGQAIDYGFSKAMPWLAAAGDAVRGEQAKRERPRYRFDQRQAPVSPSRQIFGDQGITQAAQSYQTPQERESALLARERARYPMQPGAVAHALESGGIAGPTGVASAGLHAASQVLDNPTGQKIAFPVQSAVMPLLGTIRDAANRIAKENGARPEDVIAGVAESYGVNPNAVIGAVNAPEAFVSGTALRHVRPEGQYSPVTNAPLQGATTAIPGLAEFAGVTPYFMVPGLGYAALPAIEAASGRPLEQQELETDQQYAARFQNSAVLAGVLPPVGRALRPLFGGAAGAVDRYLAERVPALGDFGARGLAATDLVAAGYPAAAIQGHPLPTWEQNAQNFMFGAVMPAHGAEPRRNFEAERASLAGFSPELGAQIAPERPVGPGLPGSPILRPRYDEQIPRPAPPPVEAAPPRPEPVRPPTGEPTIKQAGGQTTHLVRGADGRTGLVNITANGRIAFVEVTNPQRIRQYGRKPALELGSDEFDTLFPKRAEGYAPGTVDDARNRFVTEDLAAKTQAPVIPSQRAPIVPRFDATTEPQAPVPATVTSAEAVPAPIVEPTAVPPEIPGQPPPVENRALNRPTPEQWAAMLPEEQFAHVQAVHTARETAQQHADIAAEEARTDFKTGAGNDRSYAEAFDRVKAETGDEPIITMVDANGLKAINDEAGHEAGDQLLKIIVGKMKDQGLAIHRVGGDEFAIVGRDGESQAAATERALEDLRQHEITVIDNNGNEVVVSNVSYAHGTGKGRAEADARLYEHKKAQIGTDRAEVRGETPPGLNIRTRPNDSTGRSGPEIAPDTAEGPAPTVTGESAAEASRAPSAAEPGVTPTAAVTAAPGEGGANKGAAARPQEAELQPGHSQKIMGMDATVHSSARVDGVDYELWESAKGKGVVRVKDADSGEVVSIKPFNSFDDARGEYADALTALGVEWVPFGRELTPKELAGGQTNAETIRSDEGPSDTTGITGQQGPVGSGSDVQQAPPVAPDVVGAPGGGTPQEPAAVPKEVASRDDVVRRMGEIRDRLNKLRVVPGQIDYSPEIKALRAPLEAELDALGKQLRELDRPAREAAEAEAARRRDTASEARAGRVKEAPTFQTRNGWEIVKVDGEFVARHPDSKEEVYSNSKLSRVREVSDESAPEAATTPPVDEAVPPTKPAKLTKKQEAQADRLSHTHVDALQKSLARTEKSGDTATAAIVRRALEIKAAREGPAPTVPPVVAPPTKAKAPEAAPTPPESGESKRLETIAEIERRLAEARADFKKRRRGSKPYNEARERIARMEARLGELRDEQSKAEQIRLRAELDEKIPLAVGDLERFKLMRRHPDTKIADEGWEGLKKLARTEAEKQGVPEADLDEIATEAARNLDAPHVGEGMEVSVKAATEKIASARKIKAANEKTRSEWEKAAEIRKQIEEQKRRDAEAAAAERARRTMDESVTIPADHAEFIAKMRPAERTTWANDAVPDLTDAQARKAREAGYLTDDGIPTEKGKALAESARLHVDRLEAGRPISEYTPGRYKAEGVFPNGGQVKGEPWFTNSHYAIKGENPKGSETTEGRYSKDMPPIDVSRVLPKGKLAVVKPVAFEETYSTDKYQKNGLKRWTVFSDGAKFDSDYLDLIQRTHGDGLEWKRGTKEGDPMVAVKNNETVAVIMPVHIEHHPPGTAAILEAAGTPKPKGKAAAKSPVQGDPMAATSRVPPAPDPITSASKSPEEVEAEMLGNDRMPVSTEPTEGAAKGKVSSTHVIQSFENVLKSLGRDVPIRVGRFRQKAYGIFKPHEEVIRLRSANNIPTAAHELGHGVQKAIWDVVKSKDFKKVLPGPVKAELSRLGRALYGDTKPAAGYTGEGFAEFMRHYLTRDDAAQIAPATVKFFDETVLPKNPKLAKSIAEARKTTDTYRNEGARNRADANMAKASGVRERIAKALASLKNVPTDFIDELTPLLHLSKDYERITGKTLRPGQDPFKVGSALRGTSSAKVEYMIFHGMLDAAGNQVGPSLSEAAAMVKGRKDDFTAYLWARRAQERWAQGKNPGMSLADANHLVDSLGTPEFQMAADRVYDWNAGVLNYVKQMVPDLAESVDRILGSSENYVPLNRAFDEPSTSLVDRLTGRGGGNPLKAMRGSGRRVIDIFPQMIANSERLVAMAHKRKVTDLIFRMADAEGMGHIIEEVPVDQVPHTEPIERFRAQLEKAGAELPEEDMNELLTFFTPAQSPKGKDPIIPRIVGGRMRWYQVNGELYRSLTGLDLYRLPKAVDLMLGAPARAFRLGTTGLRPAFSLFTNPVRDVQTFLAQTKSHHNPAQLAADYFHGMGEAMDPRRLIGRHDPMLETFMRLGGQLGQPLGADIQQTSKPAKRLFRSPVGRVVTSPINALRELLSLPEAGPRIAELHALADQVGWDKNSPMTFDQAIQLGLAAKQVTVDFSSMGRIGKVVNQVAPFFNPNIQGTRQMARTLRTNPKRAIAWGLSTITMPALALWWLNKDEDWYKDLPDAEKFAYYHVQAGDQRLKIPRAFEWGNVFSVVPEAIMDAWYRKDPEGVKGAMGYVFNTTMPNIEPVPLKIAHEQWQNRIEFFDRPIVPQAELDKFPGEQRGPYTSGIARWLGDTFPNTISPRRVDAFIQAAGGGVAADIASATTIGKEKTRGFEPSDIPVFGRAFATGGKEGLNSKAIEDFYGELAQSRAKQRSSTAPETAAERKYRLKLEDARTALQVLRDAANSAKSQSERQTIQRKMRQLVQNVMTPKRAQLPLH